MVLLLLEALAALLILVFIVWWTMFSGRQGGEISPTDDTHTPGKGAPDPKAPDRNARNQDSA